MYIECTLKRKNKSVALVHKILKIKGNSQCAVFISNLHHSVVSCVDYYHLLKLTNGFAYVGYFELKAAQMVVKAAIRGNGSADRKSVV